MKMRLGHRQVHVAWKRKMLHDVIADTKHIFMKRFIYLFIACVAGVRKGRGKELRRESACEGGGGGERLQGSHCFSHPSY